MNNKIIVSRKRSYERFYIKNIIYLVMYNKKMLVGYWN